MALVDPNRIKASIAQDKVVNRPGGIMQPKFNLGKVEEPSIFNFGYWREEKAPLLAAWMKMDPKEQDRPDPGLTFGNLAPFKPMEDAFRPPALNAPPPLTPAEKVSTGVALAVQDAVIDVAPDEIPAEQAGVDVALEAQGNGLMSRPASDAAPTAIESPDTTADTTTTANSFYQDIGEHAETDHGSTPIATADASESHLAAAARSKDVGYGHKIARGGAEDTSGIIHGIQFKNADGTYIPLTNAQKSTILEADMAANLNIARTADVGGWDTKLAEINTTWDALDSKYQNALTSLAFNVGGTKAADKWTAVLKKAKDKDITGFATDMRRKDNDQYTAGMDNRVAKELYYSGIISNLSEVATQLPLASASTSGIPE